MKVRIVPNRWNWTVTTAVPPGIEELCGTGNGNIPPTRKRAGCPSRAIKFGSARIFARLLERKASMNSEKCPASNTPKSGEVPAGVAVLVPPTVPWIGTGESARPEALIDGRVRRSWRMSRCCRPPSR